MNGQSVAKMKRNGPPHFQLVIDYWDAHSDAKLLVVHTWRHSKVDSVVIIMLFNSKQTSRRNN